VILRTLILTALLVSPALAQATFTDDTLTLVTPTGTLVGSLMRPVGSTSVPVVLLHPGSGPTTRDGNSAGLPGKSMMLRQLAESLSAHGIASLRIDKRGIGSSAAALGDPTRFLITGYVDDAVRWIEQLRTMKQFLRIYVAGHSEGALILTMAAQRAPVAGLVLISGAGRTAADVLREQFSTRLPPAMQPEANAFLSAAAAGDTTAKPPALMAGLFPPSVMPYLRSWLPIDPAAELARVTCPVLVFQGTTDAQVSVVDARRLAGAKPAATLVLADGINHVLKRVGGDLAAQVPSYSSPTPAVDAAVVTPLAAFVQARR
jgi:uncharacterized protein